jgi:hypothetical protein
MISRAQCKIESDRLLIDDHRMMLFVLTVNYTNDPLVIIAVIFGPNLKGLGGEG